MPLKLLFPNIFKLICNVEIFSFDMIGDKISFKLPFKILNASLSPVTSDIKSGKLNGFEGYFTKKL